MKAIKYFRVVGSILLSGCLTLEFMETISIFKVPILLQTVMFSWLFVYLIIFLNRVFR